MGHQSDADLQSLLAADRAQALVLNQDSVSRETWARLDGFVTRLLRHQQTTNLIAASTVGRIWTRHIADSLQLLPLAPGALRWIDLGSGAGFPGLLPVRSREPRAHMSSWSKVPRRKQDSCRSASTQSACRALCTRNESRILPARTQRNSRSSPLARSPPWKNSSPTQIRC